MATSLTEAMAADMRLSTIEPSKFDDQGQRNRSISNAASSLEPQNQRTSEDLNKCGDEKHLHDESVLSSHDECHVLHPGK